MNVVLPQITKETHKNICVSLIPFTLCIRMPEFLLLQRKVHPRKPVFIKDRKNEQDPDLLLVLVSLPTERG